MGFNFSSNLLHPYLRLVQSTHLLLIWCKFIFIKLMSALKTNFTIFLTVSCWNSSVHWRSIWCCLAFSLWRWLWFTNICLISAINLLLIHLWGWTSYNIQEHSIILSIINFKFISSIKPSILCLLKHNLFWRQIYPL